MKFNLRIFLSFFLFSFPIIVNAQQGRQIIPLNNDWQFAKAPDTSKKAARLTGWQQVNIPHTWNKNDMQTVGKFYTGDAYYRKTFSADKAWKNKKVFIRFEGVGQVADVYVNSHFIGEHKGSFAAFCFEIGHMLKFDSVNTITVKVNNTPRKDIIPINNFLFPIYGGIYRPVSLIVTDKLNITTTDYASSGVYISQKNVSEKSADIDVKIKLDNAYRTTKNITFKTALYDETNRLVQQENQQIIVLPQGRQTFDQPIHLQNPHLWNGRKDPYLYKVIAGIYSGDTLLDEVTQPLGVRSFEIVAGKGFYLNGKPYRLYGVCRHQDILGYGNALSNAQHDSDMAMIKEIGATSVRFGHYQQDERVYSDCDSIGFLVWTEIPFVNAVSGQEAYNAEQQMTELIRQNYNHPSIYCWATSNEVYEKTPEDYTSQLIERLNDIAKTEDPDRYSISTNGYGQISRSENFHTDLQGVNRYFGWYEGKMNDLEQWIENAEKNYPDAKIAIAEYGAEANINQQNETDTLTPPQYDGQYFPENYQTKLHEVQWGIIEKHPYLFATYVWNMFDFATPLWNRGGVPGRNMKGLVTFDRKVKKDAFYWYKANWSDEPVLYITGRRDSLRKTVITNVTVYSNISTPELFVNGKKISNPAIGTTKVDYIFNNVRLKKGVNIISAKGFKNNQPYTDEIKWFLK
ncbi:beta-galactosidase [Arachidicoccus ginsenosidimutans]|uniref:glycoside hydrolase family 2 protein n=1 Tax=Arachidicoccus sp. BS20 TaxID=1850526 RepID=UPI0007F0A75E|nr:glycoside hydrolase family 2 TIM barrel-domain containing protein [Arachidicoccus sp. BS20]ANI88584.1 beta-galactosidase [Arachidicoccus sp. BS20]